MDLVKSHLMFAVREEVDVLKDKIVGLMERIQSLETENAILKQAQMGGQHTQSLLTSINISHPTSPINDPAIEGTEAPVSSSTPTSMLAITVSTGNNSGIVGATSPQNPNPVAVPGNGGNNNSNASQSLTSRPSNPATGSVSPEETSGKWSDWTLDVDKFISCQRHAHLIIPSYCSWFGISFFSSCDSFVSLHSLFTLYYDFLGVTTYVIIYQVFIFIDTNYFWRMLFHNKTMINTQVKR